MTSCLHDIYTTLYTFYGKLHSANLHTHTKKLNKKIFIMIVWLRKWLDFKILTPSNFNRRVLRLKLRSYMTEQKKLKQLTTENDNLEVIIVK